MFGFKKNIGIEAVLSFFAEKRVLFDMAVPGDVDESTITPSVLSDEPDVGEPPGVDDLRSLVESERPVENLIGSLAELDEIATLPDLVPGVAQINSETRGKVRQLFSRVEGAELNGFPRDEDVIRIGLFLKELNSVAQRRFARARAHLSADLLVEEEADALIEINLSLSNKVRSYIRAHSAGFDSLTGLRNRGNGERAVESSLSREPGCFLIIDIDHFKRWNETMGHDGADRALRAIAQVLKSGIRPADIEYRYGGEEMAIWLPRTGLEGAKIVADRILRDVNQVEIDEHKGFAVSCGIYGPYDSTDPESEEAKIDDRELYDYAFDLLNAKYLMMLSDRDRGQNVRDRWLNSVGGLINGGKQYTDLVNGTFNMASFLGFHITGLKSKYRLERHVMHRADKALFRAKNTGRNKYVVYDPSME